jgi:hypothetical protein
MDNGQFIMDNGQIVSAILSLPKNKQQTTNHKQLTINNKP